MINFVTLDHIRKVWDKKDVRKETFIAESDDGSFVACDNTKGKIDIEMFKTLWGALKWCTLKKANAEEIRKDEIVHRAFEREMSFEL
jgi:hypothetical protein